MGDTKRGGCGQGVVWGTLKEVGVGRGGVGDTKRGGCGQGVVWGTLKEVGVGRGWCGGH